MVNNKYWFPLLLVLLLFLIDKVVLIPAVQSCCTQYRGNPFESMANYDFKQDAIVQAARESGRKIILNLGTSRSMGYYRTPTPEHIAVSQYLTDAERKTLSEYQIVNSSLPGASILSAYVRMAQWLDHGLKPDQIWVEISPFSFNKNSMWASFELKHGVPADFALRYLNRLPAEHSKTILTSRLFQVIRFRPGSADQSKSQWENLFAEATRHLDQLPRGIPPYTGVEQGRESKEQLLKYRYVSSEMERTMFQGYKMDPVYARYLDLIRARAQEQGIALVFWKPASHPLWQSVLKRNDSATHWMTEWNRTVARLKTPHSSYLDMDQEGLLHCRFFVDPVHIGNRCYPEMAVRTLQAGAAIP
ncbi:MAG: DUF1574 family protein [Leptospiraceae bacterium]|nr:DUF1574 family protein [Leptospiraceae bacterium]